MSLPFLAQRRHRLAKNGFARTKRSAAGNEKAAFAGMEVQAAAQS
jgi:hypothetical protein